MKKKSQKKVNNSLVAPLKLWWGRLPADVPIKDYFLIFICVVLILSLVFFWEDAFAKFLITVIGGGLFILQIFNSNRRATAAEKTADSMRETVELNEKGHIAERFKNAIEHLGERSASTRLGGIYALHNLARDVDEYREQVFEILCAHIRETTTRKSYASRVKKHGNKGPITEIQVILNLLFESEKNRQIYIGFSANLKEVDLNGIILTKAVLRGADLTGANLLGAQFQHADLQHAIFDYAYLYGASLDYADFRGCSFVESNMGYVDLVGAKNLKINQLLQAETLYEANLAEKIEKEIRRLRWTLLEQPADERVT